MVSGIQRHAQCAHVETEAAQQHQTRLQKLCDNFWSRVWFCCSRVRTNQKKVVKTTFQFQAIFPNQTLHQKDVTESAPLRSRRECAIFTNTSRHVRFAVQQYPSFSSAPAELTTPSRNPSSRTRPRRSPRRSPRTRSRRTCTTSPRGAEGQTRCIVE